MQPLQVRLVEQGIRIHGSGRAYRETRRGVVSDIA
jgi:hypothetical protein